MSRIKCISIIPLIIILSFNANYSKKSDNFDMINKIIYDNNCSVEQYGIKIEFISDKNSNSIIEVLNKNIELKKINVTEASQNNSSYTEFLGESVHGIIIRNKINDKYKYTLTIFNDDYSQNEIFASIIQEILDELEINKKNSLIHWCIKSKIEKVDLDIKEINNQIINILEMYDSKNIETIKINNGYSTIAYTNKFVKEKVNNKFIDLNIAVCEYNSGKYLIIGSPEIFISY